MEDFQNANGGYDSYGTGPGSGDDTATAGTRTGPGDKLGWKLVGFPGVAAVYTTLVDKHGVPYEVEPVSILDMLEGRAAADEHGHPKHIVLTRKD